MMRKTILFAALALLLTLPVAAAPATNPAGVLGDCFDAIAEFVETLFANEPPASPGPDDGEGEIGLSIDPDG